MRSGTFRQAFGPRFGRWRSDPEQAWSLAIALTAFLLLAMRQGYRVPLTNGMAPAPVAAVLGAVLLVGGALAGRPFCTLAIRRVPLLPMAVAVLLAAVTWFSVGQATTGSSPAMALLTTSYALQGALAALAAFLVITAVVRSPDSIVRVLGGFVAGGTVSALMGLITYTTGRDLAPLIRLPGLPYDDTTLVTDLTREDTVRPQGSAGHPLELSSVLVILIPVAVSLAVYARRRGAPGWHWIAAALVLTVAAATTLSRSALVGLGVGAVVFALYWPLRRTITVLTGCGAAVAALWLFEVPLLHRLTAVVIQGSNDGSLQSRRIAREYAEDVVYGHLWLGQGPGTYDTRVQPVLDNNWLLQLVSVGVLGLIALLAFNLLGVWAGVRAGRRLRPSGVPQTELVPGLLAAILVIMVIGLVLDISGFAQVSMLTTALIALTVALNQWSISRPRGEGSPPSGTPSNRDG